jgi:hypothetical protein
MQGYIFLRKNYNKSITLIAMLLTKRDYDGIIFFPRSSYIQIRINRYYEDVKKSPEFTSGVFTIGVLRTLFKFPRRGWQSQGTQNIFDTNFP